MDSDQRRTLRSIWWIRRDLRLSDQPTLLTAAAAGQVVPVFVLDPALLSRRAPKRVDFLLANLRSLDDDLKQRGARLIVRHGSPHVVLPNLMAEIQADAVFAEEDYTPFARRRDALVQQACTLQLVPGQCVHRPGEVTKSDGSPYVVYTPFARAWKSRLPRSLMPLEAPKNIDMPPGIATEALPATESPAGFPAGEAEAQRRLREFVDEDVFRYGEHRDRMDLDGTSSLSPYLRFGVLSIRTAVAAALAAAANARIEDARTSAETWLNELIWREFYISILHHFPQINRGPFKEEFRAIQWRNHSEEYERWKEGRTGVPVVDAAMRQLRQTGWMHNRARMITASYLVKDLLIDWRWGERWFMENLIDGDISANNGGWQWTAGTGTDAAPYFRIFNPVLQGKRFDPNGDYVRRWVPELAHLPAAVIHAPWEKAQAAAGYPESPLVEHATAIRRTRLAYESARGITRTKGKQ